MDAKKAKAKAKAVKAEVKAKVKAKVKACAALLGVVLLLEGCQDPGRAAAYSNTLNADRCVVVIADRAKITDGVVDAEAYTNSVACKGAAYDIFSQGQNLENSGQQSADARQTPSMTIDTDAAFDIPVNKMNSGTSAAGGAAEKLLGAGADWLSSKIGTGGTTTATATATNADTSKTAASADCPDGKCADKSCTDCELK